jgi:hypothetical protein
VQSQSFVYDTRKLPTSTLRAFASFLDIARYSLLLWTTNNISSHSLCSMHLHHTLQHSVCKFQPDENFHITVGTSQVAGLSIFVFVFNDYRKCEKKRRCTKQYACSPWHTEYDWLTCTGSARVTTRPLFAMFLTFCLRLVLLTEQNTCQNTFNFY